MDTYCQVERKGTSHTSDTKIKGKDIVDLKKQDGIYKGVKQTRASQEVMYRYSI